MSKKDFNDSLRRRIQYLGVSGYTEQCLIAIDAILNSGWLPKKAIIVSKHLYRNNPTQQDHLFLFVDWALYPITVVPSGFASGYRGEGPSGFSLAICMIREKGIPISGICLNDVDFERINRGEVKYSDDALFRKILLKSEEYSWPWPGWTNGSHEQMLERGLLWCECYWRQPPTDQITKAISEIDIEFPLVGKKLRLARRKIIEALPGIDELQQLGDLVRAVAMDAEFGEERRLARKKIIEESQGIEELQQVGILVRDAWIEFSKAICKSLKVNTTGIKNDAVIDRLRKLKLEDELSNSCKASFNLSLKVQHDRGIRGDEAEMCLLLSIFSMRTLIRELAVGNSGSSA